MTFRDYARTTRTALRALRRNVLRSVLTTLGIIIGVASLITIAEIGKGSAKAIIGVMETTGANTLLVQAGAASSNGVSLGSGTIKTLTPEDALAIQQQQCAAVGDSWRADRLPAGNRSSTRTSNLGADLHLRDHPRPAPGAATGSNWPKARPSATTTSATSPWSACWARPWCVERLARRVKRVADRQGGAGQRRPAPGRRGPLGDEGNEHFIRRRPEDDHPAGPVE